MKTLEQRKEVEQAYLDGRDIYITFNENQSFISNWAITSNPKWNWDVYDYDYTLKDRPDQLVFESNLQDSPKKEDAGKHYRFKYKDINLDPYRIAYIYGIADPVQFTVLKKVLIPGSRGKKDLVQDWKDILNAAERKLEMLEEDNNLT